MFVENLRDVPDYVSGTKGNEDFIRLSSNENNYGPSPKVIKQINRLSKVVFKYPESSYYSLKEVIAKQNNVYPSQVILGNGSDEIFLNLFLMYLSPETNIITIEKTFTYYKILSRIIGSQIIEAKRNNDFSISCDSIIKSLNSNTKIVIFPSPDNPTGVIINKECIERILKSISCNTIFILDEAYFQFVPKEKYWNSIEFIKKYPNFVITRTFSKLYGLAGVRIGYGICSEEVAKLYEKIRMPFNISLVAVESAKEALLDKKYYNNVLVRIVEDREFLKGEFRKLGLNVLEESYGNFIFLQGPKDLDKKLFEMGVVIRNLKSFGYDETYYRITVGTRKQNKILLNYIRKILGGMNG